MNINVNALYFLLLMTCLSVYVANAQQYPPSEVFMRSVKGPMVKSTANGKTYQLFMTLPARYNSNDATRYPVLYQLDGYYAFPLVNTLKTGMEAFGELTDFIVVSIADSIPSGAYWYRNRWTDLTPWQDQRMDSLQSLRLRVPQGSFRSGGGAAFLQTLKTDIIPFVDQHYKTTDDRSINGHSFGGLFAMYCLLTEPTMFRRYGIHSCFGPSFTAEKTALLQTFGEQIARRSGKTINAQLFMSVGSLEPGEADGMVTFARSLNRQSINGLTVKTYVFDNETHESMLGAYISRTLREFYSAKPK